MDLSPTPDQLAVRDGVRDACARLFPRERLQDPDVTAEPFDRKTWAGLTELGLFALRIPESAGGLGLGYAEEALAYVELGRTLVPGPYPGTQLAAAWDRAVPPRPAGLLDLAAGEPYLLAHGDLLETLTVIEGDGVWVVDPQAVDKVPDAESPDPLTPLTIVSAPELGEPIGGAEAARRLRRDYDLLLAAQQVGIALETAERAVAYAKERVQFGERIGSFQAVKHLCADMYARAELARAGLYAAAASCDYPDSGDAERAVRSARVIADEAAIGNARTSIQVHGGMGFTWELGLHFYLRRAMVNASYFTATGATGAPTA